MSTAERTVCVRCTAPYLPTLTRHRCPVCDTPAPGPAPRRRAWDDPDDRMLAIVALATLANVLLLALLTLVVLT
ncbi:MAG: hypothetical protein WCD35_11880 [Mycobacteriales bacterium]